MVVGYNWPMMRNHPTNNTEALVLKNLNYRDSDRLYTLFTEQYGKVTAVARGVRKLSSKRSGNLDTLNLVNVRLSKDIKGFYTIEEVKTINSYKNVKKELSLLMKSYYLVEIIHRLVEEHHCDKALFDLVKKTLTLLTSPTLPAGLTVNYFEVRFLSLMGYELGLAKCLACGKPYSPEWVSSWFSTTLGGLICDACANGGSGGKGGFVAKIKSAEVLHKLSKNILPANIPEDILAETDSIIKNFLTQTLDVRFRSLEI